VAVRGVRLGADDRAGRRHGGHLRRHRGDRRSVVVPAARRRVGALRHRLHPAGPRRAARGHVRRAAHPRPRPHGGRGGRVRGGVVLQLRADRSVRAARGDARGAAGRPVVGVGARRVDGGGGDRLSGRHPRGAGRGRRPHPRAGDDRAVRRRGAHPSRADRRRGVAAALEPRPARRRRGGRRARLRRRSVPRVRDHRGVRGGGALRPLGRPRYGPVPGVPRDLLRDLGVGAGRRRRPRPHRRRRPRPGLGDPLAHLGPVWAQHTPAWATTPIAATARTDLADAHSALATMHRQLRRVEPAWSQA